MQRRWKLGGIVAAAGLVWWMSGGEPAESKLDGHSGVPSRTASELRGRLGGIRTGGGFRLGTIGTELRDSGLVQITGSVIDRLSKDHVGDVEIVFRGPGGEQSTMAGADGSYRIELEPGAYRAFVRDESVLSIGFPVEERLPGFPDLDAIGAPDEAAMPLVIAQSDLEDVDLFVLRGGVIYGRVHDAAGRPVAHAMVRAFQSEKRMKPALGSDVAETDADGTYELRLPAGEWWLEINHARYAGITEDDSTVLSAGDKLERSLTVVAGCVITGKVVAASGAPAGDGALELGFEGGFAPAGRILADGTFRYTTTGAQEIRLRAWPWKSPPSPEQRFECREGARFATTFQIPARGPDIGGLLVDERGTPVAMAYFDLEPLDEGGLSQQERSGADGTWGVFAMPAGRYQLTAYAPGRGVISTVVTSPSANVRLQLGGTGTLEGTVKGFANGSFELVFAGCSVDGNPIKITEVARLVSVRGGKFTVDGLPACSLTARAKWRDNVRRIVVSVTPNTRTPVEIDFEPKDEPDVPLDPQDDSSPAEIEMPADDEPYVPPTAASIY
jgi:hypothetical protein